MTKAAVLTLVTSSTLMLVGPVSFPGPGSASVIARQSAGPSPTEELLGKYCITCHNDGTLAGGLSVSDLDAADLSRDTERWEKILHKLQTGQMPPAGRPRPAKAVLDGIMARLESGLDAVSVQHPPASRVGAHRLNRTEYANAIRDLFGLQVDARRLLLPDEADQGFDNVAVSLAMSPTHIERYLSAAREISRLAVGDITLGHAPSTDTYTVPKLLEQDVRVSEELPFGSRGGLAIRYQFPVDGEYVFKVRLRRQVYDYIVGMGHPQQLDLRVDGKRVKRFTVGGEGTGTPGPLTWNGEIVGDTKWELYMHAADAGLEVRLPVGAGSRAVSVAFVDSPWEIEEVEQPLPVDFLRGADEQYDGYAAVDALTIHGPYAADGPGDTPSRRAVMVCVPRNPAEEGPCAQRILSTLARRAYRRPVTSDELTTLLSFYEAGRRNRGFEAGIQSALERMLVSFNFLFRIERDPENSAPESVYALGDLDLASRLSFFLWSSIPDDELLDLAERGRLREPGVLEQQVRRMLQDPRARALVDSFGSQWLGLRKAASHSPDPNLFPEFDENLRAAFVEESSRFLESQIREDRSILDLISADYTFVNERLARHYGIPNVSGERFRRVTSADGTRGGLLGQGGILMVTSYPDRTAPVLRGFWVLENLLGMPPPPPPPNIPDLETIGEDGRALSMREQMEVHRRSPACSGCHVRMDPIGFAMENFDAIGGWRTRTGGNPVDVSAVFADGTPIEGVRGLRSFLLQHREAYVRTFAQKLLTFALGRHVDHRDQPAVRAITRKAAAADHRWSAMVLAIVESTPFQMRKAAS